MDLILLIKYILLGMVQGFTEPLPISSSGHLVLFQEFFNLSIEGPLFEIVVNAGSLIAIIAIFYKDIIELILKFFGYVFKGQKENEYEFKYALMLVLAVIPAGLAGLVLNSYFDALSNVMVVGISLLVTSIALSLVSKQAIEDGKEKINFLDAITIGLFQVFALVPGISRSGATMVGGLSRKVNFKETMKFSFLLYIPISLATILLAVLDISSGATFFVTGFISAFIVSTITTYFAVKWLFTMVSKGNLKYFSLYCLIVGLTVLIVNFLVGGL